MWIPVICSVRISLNRMTMNGLENRITKLETQMEYVQKNNELIISLDKRVEVLEKMMAEHMEYHKELAKQIFSYKQGIVFIFMQIIFNAIAIYILTKVS